VGPAARSAQRPGPGRLPGLPAAVARCLRTAAQHSSHAPEAGAEAAGHQQLGAADKGGLGAWRARRWRYPRRGRSAARRCSAARSRPAGRPPGSVGGEASGLGCWVFRTKFRAPLRASAPECLERGAGPAPAAAVGGSAGCRTQGAALLWSAARRHGAEAAAFRQGPPAQPGDQGLPRLGRRAPGNGAGLYPLRLH